MNVMGKALDEKLLVLRRDAEERDAQRRAEQLGLPYLDLAKAPFQVDALKFVPEEDAKAARVAMIQAKSTHLTLAAYDASTDAVKKIVERLQKEHYKVDVLIGSLSGLQHLWESYQYLPKEQPQITGVFEVSKVRIDELEPKLATLAGIATAIGKFDFKTAKTADILDIILLGALMNRASDIHFEPEERAVRIRYRVDGLLHDVVTDFGRDVYGHVLSRFKLLSGLKLNITGEPQNGRYSIKLPDSKEIEIRVSTAPSQFGETIVMRALYQDALSMSLEDLGLRSDDLAIVREELKAPNGMILNTGPTGSGKTTTLYVFLRAEQTPELKIITIEDPIEYHLNGIEQTQVDRGAKYDFASGLHSIVRQDPDIILVGEVNDKETAEIAIQAALTGHLVFSTVHANNAPAAIPRLIDLGIKPSSIGPALNLVIAQRLLRRLCPHCKTAQHVDEALRATLKKLFAALPKRVVKPKLEDIKLYAPKGCEKCGGLGYKGRVGVFELFRIDEKVEQAIHDDASEAALHAMAKAQGMTTMQEDGALKAIAGMTSLAEVEAATGRLQA